MIGNFLLGPVTMGGYALGQNWLLLICEMVILIKCLINVYGCLLFVCFPRWKLSN